MPAKGFTLLDWGQSEAGKARPAASPSGVTAGSPGAPHSKSGGYTLLDWGQPPSPMEAPAGGPPVLPPAGGVDWSKGGRVNIQEVTPNIKAAIVTAAGELKGQGIDLPALITSGFRTRADQERIYSQNGQPGIYTPAKPGTSPHEKGLAVDVGIKHLPAQQQQAVVSALENAGLYRPHPDRDPVHWQVKSGSAASSPPASKSATRRGFTLLDWGD